jgi:hypothetical protein
MRVERKKKYDSDSIPIRIDSGAKSGGKIRDSRAQKWHNSGATSQWPLPNIMQSHFASRTDLQLNEERATDAASSTYYGAPHTTYSSRDNKRPEKALSIQSRDHIYYISVENALSKQVPLRNFRLL